MKKRWLLLLIVFALVVAACGGDDDDAGGDTGDTRPQPQAATDETPAPTEAPATTTTARRRRRRTDGRRHPAVADPSRQRRGSGGLPSHLGRARRVRSRASPLDYEPGGTETAGYQQTLLTELSAGTAPDVFWLPGTDIADFATRGVILDLRAAARMPAATTMPTSTRVRCSTSPSTPRPGNTGETLWGLPRDVSAFGLYMNTDLIAEAGVDDPRELAAAGNWNWDTFREVIDGIGTLGGEVVGYGQSSWWGPYGVLDERRRWRLLQRRPHARVASIATARSPA